jgi:hypothetical protein
MTPWQQPPPRKGGNRRRGRARVYSTRRKFRGRIFFARDTYSYTCYIVANQRAAHRQGRRKSLPEAASGACLLACLLSICDQPDANPNLRTASSVPCPPPLARRQTDETPFLGRQRCVCQRSVKIRGLVCAVVLSRNQTSYAYGGRRAERGEGALDSRYHSPAPAPVPLVMDKVWIRCG